MRLALIVLGVLAAPAFIPSVGAVQGNPEYDLTVSARVEWHAMLRYWEIDAPGVAEASPSKLVNYDALLKNALFFGHSDARTVHISIETDGRVLDTIEQRTPEGSRIGAEKYIHVVFRHIEPGSYLLRGKILEPDGTTIDEATALVNVGGA